MSLLTENATMYGVPEKEVQHKKYDLIPHCKYNDGVSCEEKGRKCNRCGWNPKVSDMRIEAIKMGDTHFLRFTDRRSEFSDEDIKMLIQSRT